MKFILLIALLLLLGCASSKPVVTTDDDHRCEGFYETVNVISKKDKLDFAKILGFHKAPVFPIDDNNNPKMVCLETISCNKTEYCISVMVLEDSRVMNFLQPERWF
jgi:hypothetical protein